MELNSGGDLVSMKEILQSQCSLSTENPSSNLDADEYARCNGLTVDSCTDPWLCLIQSDTAVASTLTPVEPGQLLEDGSLQECYFRPIIAASEQWELPPQSLAVLQDALKRPKVDELADLMDNLCFIERNKDRQLRLEPPLLRTDHEADCRRLTKRATSFRKAQLLDHRLPIEPADTAKGEGLEFSSVSIVEDKMLMASVEDEKLNMDHNDFNYLVDTLKADWTIDDQKNLLGSTYPYHGLGAAEPLTPPLSPMEEPPIEPYIPENETCHIPDPSDPSSDLSADILVAESRILQDDQEFWAENLQNHASPEKYDEVDVPEMLRSGAFRLSPVPMAGPAPIPQDFHLDVPIFADQWPEGNGRERTRVLTREEIDQMKALMMSSDTVDETGEQLMDFFQDRATQATRRAEQEQLQPLDAIARVTVPFMDFSIPRPEWEERILNPEAMMRQIRNAEDVDWQGPKWQGNRATEQKMVWAPLAHMRRKSLVSENIEVDPEVLDHVLRNNEDSEIPTSADYVYKQPRLAILRMDDDDEDDYIKPLGQSPQASSSLIVSNRQPFLTQAADSTPTSRTASNVRSKVLRAEKEARQLGRKQITLGKRILNQDRARQGNKNLARTYSHTLDGPSQTPPSTKLLVGFEHEFPELGLLINGYADTYFPKPADINECRKSEQAGTEIAPGLLPPPLPSPQTIPATAPTIMPPTPLPKIVISSTVSGPIIDNLEALLPGMEVIARNHGAHAPPEWAPGMRSPNLDEADITISPCTGLMISTVVKLRQKPVPGQARNAAGLAQILQNVATRYERLVVLVTEGNKHAESMTPLSRGDARALAEFQGFAAGLDTEVHVLYVGGGMETLAKWIAKTICDHVQEQVPVAELLLPGQSYWEVFLNRAGMNVFAAQVVLGVLQEQEDGSAVGAAGGPAYGLPCFIMMPREERIELFSDLLGGRKVLERVSQALEEPWGQVPVGGC
ncbi:hypothetical protein QBC42DRAFT_303042 [Cladorrhinum samala]|uniref:Uncharacterized protein n=1 Tax=Cladorrhinum samala TaxID=585594 RepID=A0AAV9I1I8_9PEZI|nr:hypothetical protein QBC42DRAFT_303042 [Cladorrhinum samala]